MNEEPLERISTMAGSSNKYYFFSPECDSEWDELKSLLFLDLFYKLISSSLLGLGVFKLLESLIVLSDEEFELLGLGCYVYLILLLLYLYVLIADIILFYLLSLSTKLLPI